MKRRKIDGWPVKLAVLSISTILVSAPSVNGALPQMRDSLHVTQAQVEALSGEQICRFRSLFSPCSTLCF
ncbi:hypothetical protein OZX74_02625 [Bifidobacterium sp. ESL0798]|uniref:hypothetical protein n=1 Tax=Bifidobacterium sp. ESL0798 TaxID=2983235 RepID=UPI0023F63B82|nr:hypothetical protein [Bifidobacterium sp. ESL0798]WEV74453.1 hypothetical protein OZX74_02625 [Bifidobacterium sp. ESL0798]